MVSNFSCEKCGAICSDSPKGYVTGCEHYPVDISGNICIGKNCNSIDGKNHSAECLAEFEKSFNYKGVG